MAAQRPDLMRRYLAVGLTPEEGQVEAITAAGRKHPDGYAGYVTLAWDRTAVGDPAALERLVVWLNEHGHAVDVSIDADGSPADDGRRIGEWIGGQTMVPPT